MDSVELQWRNSFVRGLKYVKSRKMKYLRGILVVIFLAGWAFLMPGCGDNDQVETEDDSRIPPEVPVREARCDHPTPPNGFLAAVGWMQSIHDDRLDGRSKVEVDWMRLHVTLDDGTKVVLKSDDFSAATSPMTYYGLYQRIPWYAGDKLENMPWTIDNGCLVLKPSNRPDRIFHWWNTSRTLVSHGVCRVWFEARVRITGPALVQAGVDYWKDLTIGYGGFDVNNTEAGVSDWYFESPEWQTIRVGEP